MVLSLGTGPGNRLPPAVKTVLNSPAAGSMGGLALRELLRVQATVTLAPSNPENTGAKLKMAGRADTQRLQPSATPPSCTLQEVQQALFLHGVISPTCLLPQLILAFPTLYKAACTLVCVSFALYLQHGYI